MKNQTLATSDLDERKKITLKDYYKSLPKPVTLSEKQKFLERIAKRCNVSDTTVRNWCMYGFKPQKREHVLILAEETGIPAEDLFED